MISKLLMDKGDVFENYFRLWGLWGGGLWDGEGGICVEEQGLTFEGTWG
jgi:hypothetical protein